MAKYRRMTNFVRHTGQADVKQGTDVKHRAVFQLSDLQRDSDGKQILDVEIFIQPGFSLLEYASVIAVFDAANEVQNRIRFTFTALSDTPGLVTNGNTSVRCEPAIRDQYLKNGLIVIGGRKCEGKAWLGRLRAMQRLNRPVVLLSDAATEYIKETLPKQIPVATHWRDIAILNEFGDFPTLSTRLGEFGRGVFTGAGKGHTIEVVFNLVADLLSPDERSEMAAHLVIDGVRGSHQEQPMGISHGNAFLDQTLKSAIKLMEETVEDPISISILADEIGISIRQLERLFKNHLNSSPAKVYKRIRLKRAHALIVDTRIPLIEIAVACGFSSTMSMSKAYRDEFGKSPNLVRKFGDGTAMAVASD